MKTTVWREPGAEIDRDLLKLRARRLHTIHQPPATAEAWASMRPRVRRAVSEAAGIRHDSTPLDLCEHGSLRLDGYRIVKLSFLSRPGLRVTANLYVPDGSGPFPGVVGTHGHFSQGKLAGRVAARGHTLAMHGFAVLIVDAFGSGERGTAPGEFEYHGKQIGASLLPLGESLLGMQVNDNMRAIDVLQSLPYVDSDRIGVTGASGGGNQTMWLAAMDERVKAAVPVVSVGTFESYVTATNCICEVLPGGLAFMEEWAVLALAAPGALLILNALRDSSPAFQVTEMIRSFNAARDVYRLTGMPDRIAYKAIDLPHGYWPEMRRHMLGWFRYWLKGEGTGWPCEIPEIPELPEKELMCFADGRRPDDVQSILSFVRSETAAAQTRPRTGSADDARRDLRALLNLGPEANARFGPVVTGVDDTRRFEACTALLANGMGIPCLRLFPKGLEPCRTVIAVHPAGKSALAQCERVEELLASEASVCLVDLANCGERQWDASQLAPAHDAARAYLWLGQPMLGVWAAELKALSLLLSQSGQRVEIAAWGECALAAAALAALTDCLAAVELHDLPASYECSAVPTCHMAAFVPGLSRWGGIAQMVALSQCHLDVKALRDLSGRDLSATEELAWREDVRSRAENLAVSRPSL